MTAQEFNTRLSDLFSEVTDQNLTFPEQTQFVGVAEYALFAWKLALAQAIARDNEDKTNKPGDHFSV